MGKIQWKSNLEQQKQTHKKATELEEKQTLILVWDVILKIHS